MKGCDDVGADMTETKTTNEAASAAGDVYGWGSGLKKRRKRMTTTPPMYLCENALGNAILDENVYVDVDDDYDAEEKEVVARMTRAAAKYMALSKDLLDERNLLMGHCVSKMVVVVVANMSASRLRRFSSV
jgi:hypothetical protein